METITFRNKHKVQLDSTIKDDAVFAEVDKEIMDQVIDEYVRETAQVGGFGDTVKETRIKCFGLVHRRDAGYIERRTLKRRQEKRKAN